MESWANRVRKAGEEEQGKEGAREEGRIAAARRRREGTHRRTTRLAWSQVTWNQVQGLTSVGSQLCSTPPGSLRLRRSAESASPSELAPASASTSEAEVARVGGRTAIGAGWLGRAGGRRGGPRQMGRERHAPHDKHGRRGREESGGQFEASSPPVLGCGALSRFLSVYLQYSKYYGPV